MLGIIEKKYLGERDIDEIGYLRKDYKPLTCISLFTGCGGAALGLRKAGFEIRVMVEWDKSACETLRINWTRAGLKKHLGYAKSGKLPDWYQEREPAILNADITQLSVDDILKAGSLRVGEATLLEGGFPCQGFSTARGRRNVDDPRNRLYEECVRVIRGTLPKTFFLENVPGLVSMEKGKIIRMICNDLANSGYDVNWDIHDAANYGVPQHRKRVLIIGSRNDVLIYLEGMEKPQLHIGGQAGQIHYPRWFEDKYPPDEKIKRLRKKAEKFNK